MKKFALLLALLSLALALPPSARAEEATRPVLRIFNWSTYIDVDESVPETEPMARRSPTLRAFAEQFGCDIDYQEYDSEDDMIGKLQGLPGFYDVVIMTAGRPTDLFTASGRLEPLTRDRIPNREIILPRFRDLAGTRANEFGLPYLGGTSGLLYNEKVVGKPVRSWDTYFNPPAHLKGKVQILNENTVMLPSALMYLGHHPNHSDPDILRRGARLFSRLKQEGFIGLVSADVEEIQQAFLEGRVALGCLYSGDALKAMQADPNGDLKYVIPEEGCEFFVDVMTVLSDAPQKELAFKFVNYVLNPDVHAAIAGQLGYLCPSKAGTEIIRRDHPGWEKNPAIVLSPADQEVVEVFANHSDDLRRLWSKLFGE